MSGSRKQINKANFKSAGTLFEHEKKKRHSLEADILYFIFLPLRVCHNDEFLLNFILLFYLLTLPRELLWVCPPRRKWRSGEGNEEGGKSVGTELRT